MIEPKVFNVLFLCTGNSTRSIMAESILNGASQGHFHAFSAGSHPTGHVTPEALEILKCSNLPTAGLRSKSWNEFAASGAPHMHFVFTVCDNAAGEVCPIWPGQPMTAHWGVPDPVLLKCSAAARAVQFNETFRMLSNRISIFTSLPLQSLDKVALQQRIEEIGRTDQYTPVGMT